MNAVFIFAHQDDEIALASRIRMAVVRGDRVTCICLTDGASRVPASVRDAESRKVLSRLGVDDFRVAAPGERIADGALPDHLEQALAFVEASVDGSAREVEGVGEVGEVVTLAWEGGHHDHDAAHLVALVFAQRRRVRCIEMPLYNGFETPDPLFRVNRPPGEGWVVRRLSRREYIANILLARFYPSQRRTWLGLAPLYLIGAPVELTREAELRRVMVPPHARPLLYERRFHYPYDRLARNAVEFLQRRSDPD